jgi:YHS domain-containing protein
MGSIFNVFLNKIGYYNWIWEGGDTYMADVVKDPVCGMEIDPKTAAGQSEFKGQIYYFCSYGCKKAFDKEPEKYVAKQGAHN